MDHKISFIRNEYHLPRITGDHVSLAVEVANIRATCLTELRIMMSPHAVEGAGCHFHDYQTSRNRPTVHFGSVIMGLGIPVVEAQSILNSTSLWSIHVCWTCVRDMFVAEDPIKELRKQTSRRVVGGSPCCGREFQTARHMYNLKYDVKETVFSPELGPSSRDSSPTRASSIDLEENTL